MYADVEIASVHLHYFVIISATHISPYAVDSEGLANHPIGHPIGLSKTNRTHYAVKQREHKKHLHLANIRI